MATVNTTTRAVSAPRDELVRPRAAAAPPHVLRCLVVSSSADRRRLIRSAAEAQAWDAIICRDAGEFLRVAFKRSVPLMVVDLPPEDSVEYRELREATARAMHACKSLLLVAGRGRDGPEEVWARSLGAWSYLNEAFTQRGFEFVLKDAQVAIERSAPSLAARVNAESEINST